MNEIKHPEYIPVHVILILGAIFMLFPFIWMISTSFKSQDEILSTTKDIVLLPDSIRPEFFNGPEEKERIERKKADAKRWEEEQAKPESERDRKVRKPFQWLDNYTYALTAQPFYRFFLNTIFVTITVTSVSLFFASLAAYAFAFFKFPLKDTIFMMILGTMMLPQQALLIPNYIFLSKIHWVNTYMALTVPWLASAYAVFFLRQFFMQLPRDL
ncbi:MAG: carbohydrate ABC transporter permease, partial [Candidatus Riflebacteria bacterium]